MKKNLRLLIKFLPRRKWNSEQLNNGILTQVFWLPEFPKVEKNSHFHFHIF